MRRKQMKKLYPLLKILNKLDDKDREILLCYLTNDGCAGVYECIHNAMYNNTIPITQRQNLQKELKKDKFKFRRLLNKNISPEKKHKTLRKVGGGVGKILQTVLPLLEKFVEEKK
jgi:hypothetical protein